MADLTRMNADDRGQMFLIGAIALALSFVALTLLLNTAIYSENIAARGDNVGGTDPHGLLNDIRRHTESTLHHVTYNQSGTKSDFLVTMRSWESMMADRYGSGGMLVDITVTNGQTVAGDRLEQDTERNFSSPSGATQWTPVTGTPASRQFELNVTYSQLASSGSSNTFTIELDGTKNISIAQGPSEGEIVVEVTNASGTWSCPVRNEKWDGKNDDHMVIDITGGTVGEVDCKPLNNVFDGLSSDYTIEFHNADNVYGTWRLIVPNNAANTGISWGAQPYRTDAVYSAELVVSYTDQFSEYRSQIRVAPGEHE